VQKKDLTFRLKRVLLICSDEDRRCFPKSNYHLLEQTYTSCI